MNHMVGLLAVGRQAKLARAKENPARSWPSYGNLVPRVLAKFRKSLVHAANYSMNHRVFCDVKHLILVFGTFLPGSNMAIYHVRSHRKCPEDEIKHIVLQDLLRTSILNIAKTMRARLEHGYPAVFLSTAVRAHPIIPHKYEALIWFVYVTYNIYYIYCFFNWR